MNFTNFFQYKISMALINLKALKKVIFLGNVSIYLKILKF